MSTFLELAKSVRQEAGLSGTGPAAVTSQFGMDKKVVDWTSRAWNEIQDQHTDWKWMWNQGSYPTVIGTSTYDLDTILTYPAASVVRDTVKIYEVSVADQSFVTYEDWGDFSVRLVGATQSGRPQIYSIRPDNQMVFWPTPDKIYTVNQDYFRTPQVLAANGDTPEAPSQFHDAIMFKALTYYAAHDEATLTFQDATANYRRILRRMEASQLPKIQTAGAMA